MRKNQYEEALFRCEDDRFDLDMHIETNASAKAALQPINLALMHMEAEDRANFRIEDSPLRAIHYTAIKRVYGNLSILLSSCHRHPTIGLLPVWSSSIFRHTPT